MKWQVAVIDGRTRDVLTRIYCEASDRMTAVRIASRVARSLHGIRRRCQFSASHWRPEADVRLLASGYVQPVRELR